MIGISFPVRTSVALTVFCFFIASIICGCGAKRASSPLTSHEGSQRKDLKPSLFEDIAKSTGITFQHNSGATGAYHFLETASAGCAFLDFDADGKLDIILLQSGPVPGTTLNPNGPSCVVYKNAGTPTSPKFVDVTHDLGLDTYFGYLNGVAVADYDNDGYPDLYLTGYGGNHLLHNQQGRKFVDVTRSSGLGDNDQGPRWACSSAWGDFDGDGLLDLYVCHYCKWTLNGEPKCVNRQNQSAYCTPLQFEPEIGRLYKNLGSGRFQDVSHASGIDKVKGRGLGAVWLDYDGDGRPDLYVTNDLSPNLLFHNVGNGRFEEIGLQVGAAYGDSGDALSGMGIALGDYNGDGREDIYVTNFSGQTNSLFKNVSNSEFVHSTHESGLAMSTVSMLGWGVNFIDYDRDGWLDLVVGNGHVNPDIEQNSSDVKYAQPKGLYHNTGKGRFEDAAAVRGDMSRPTTTRGLAVGDFNNDGRPDVLANNNGRQAELFQNKSQDNNHFVTIRLVGTKSNRDGIGARVRLTAGGKTQTLWCRRSVSYCSSSDPRLSFGIGSNSKIDSIEIWWPSRQQERIVGLSSGPIPTDSFLVCTEAKGMQRESER